MSVVDDPVAAASLRSGGRSAQDYLAKDSRTVPEVFRTSSPGFFGTEDIPTSRYLSPERHREEMAYLWPTVWQMACHEQEIPEVGDTALYEVGDLSFLVVRSAPDVVRAFHNACQHRGTKLRVEPGNVTQLRCPFHAWTWDLDGALVGIPAAWDFPQVDHEAFGLDEVQVGRWGGFVFLCPDPGAPTLEEWLGPFPEQMASSRYDERRLVRRLRKRLACNWKVAAEAFAEGYHASTTHPEYAVNIADFDSQYDVLSRYVSRMINPIGVPGPAVGYDVTEQELAESFAEVGLVDPDGDALQVPEGATARQVIADFMRGAWSQNTGVDVSALSDAELLDGIAYQVFPNFFPWAALGVPLVYRFLPAGDSPDEATMEVYVLWPHPEGEPLPPAPPVHDIGDEERWADFPELTWLGPIFDQDMVNLPRIQQGMKAMRKPGLTMAAYQESRIRHYHHMIEERIAEGRAAAGSTAAP